MKDTYGVGIEVGDTVAVSRSGTAQVYIAKVEKINKKTVTVEVPDAWSRYRDEPTMIKSQKDPKFLAVIHADLL